MQHRAQQDRERNTSSDANLPRKAEDKNDVLFDMIEESMKGLTERLAGQCTPSELRAETESLSSLLETLSLRAEFISKLFDKSTSARLRDSLRSSVISMQIEPQLTRPEMLSTSNDLIKRGASLIALAQEKINKEAHRETGYSLKTCGLCNGSSGVPEGSCVVCKGRGSLVMHEPALECPRCEGAGLARANGVAAHYISLCAQCNGTGWITAVE
jgi:hypothetical protein